jgi:DNA-binding response OmpR family regulator
MPVETPSQPKGRILVVDDEELVGRLLEYVLADAGYVVHRATGFDQARQSMAADAVDLVTLDIRMPGVTGLEALSWFRQHHPDVGVVMATGLDSIDLVLEAMRLGAYSYMIKPFHMDLVTREIERAMERQRLVAENRAHQQHLEQRVAEQTQQLREAYARLERQVRELEGRDQLVRCQLEGPSHAQAGELVLQVLHRVLAVDAALLVRVDGDEVRVAGVLGPGGQVRVDDLGAEAADWRDPLQLARRVARTRASFNDPGQGTAMPLVYQDEVLAVLWARGLDAEDYRDARNVLWRLGQASAPVLWAARVKEELDSGRLQVDELLKLQ